MTIKTATAYLHPGVTQGGCKHNEAPNPRHDLSHGYIQPIWHPEKAFVGHVNRFRATPSKEQNDKLPTITCKSAKFAMYPVGKPTFRTDD
jgi:hypothetical protein